VSYWAAPWAASMEKKKAAYLAELKVDLLAGLLEYH
jgi:hypothetical protein